jgi:Major Facilitator Superfamily
MSIAGLIAGSFAKTLASLIVTQGIMYGLGFLVFYYPILSMVDEFWVSRRGMAYGLLCSASGASGTAMPLIIEALLRKYGYPTTLRAIAIAFLVLTGPLIPMLKGRLPPTEQSVSRRTDWSFVKRPLFWIYCTSNLMQGLGYFFPSLYLPSYAASIGLGGLQGALLLGLMSFSQIVGQFSFGYLSDRPVPLNILITVSLLVSSTATFALWGVARSLAPLVVFSMFYGVFGASYVAMWARMVTAVNDEPSAALATFSVFCFGKGIGNVLAGPISAGLLLPVIDVGSYGVLRYKVVVVFTGACMLLSAVSIGTWYLKPKR